MLGDIIDFRQKHKNRENSTFGQKKRVSEISTDKLTLPKRLSIINAERSFDIQELGYMKSKLNNSFLMPVASDFNNLTVNNSYRNIGLVDAEDFEESVLFAKTKKLKEKSHLDLTHTVA